LHLVVAGLAASLSLAADAAPKSWGPFTYETIKVADNVYAFDEPKLNAIVSSNIIAVLGDKAILVFDGGHHPPVTRAITAEIRKLSSKPVKYLAISHWHDVHRPSVHGATHGNARGQTQRCGMHRSARKPGQAAA
jgi:hypothetical protein